MISIREEIKQIEKGAASKENNVLKVRSCRLRRPEMQPPDALSATARTAPRKHRHGGQVGPAILPRDCRFPRVLGAPVQVLADVRARGQRLRRPAPRDYSARQRCAGCEGCRALEL